MKKQTIIIIGAISTIVITGLISIGLVVGTLNRETDLRVAIEAKQKDNTSEFDAMWKTISQTAQVTESQKDALIEIFTGYAEARSGNNKGGSLANWIHESVPNVDTSTFNNLQNIITSKREGFAMRQKELLDLSREHNRVLKRFPSNLICSIFGRKEIELTIVTSSKTKEAFKTGEDNDINVFSK